jgi:hypothetical protein
MSKKNEDHYIRGDRDTEGYELYLRVLQEPYKEHGDFILEVIKMNPD